MRPRRAPSKRGACHMAMTKLNRQLRKMMKLGCWHNQINLSLVRSPSFVLGAESTTAIEPRMIRPMQPPSFRQLNGSPFSLVAKMALATNMIVPHGERSVGEANIRAVDSRTPLPA